MLSSTLRKLSSFLLLFLALTGNAHAAITDGKFGINQIFDVQYSWAQAETPTTPDYNCYSVNTCEVLNTSNFIAPYDKNSQTVTASSGQYFQFFPSTTNPGKYGLALYNSDGTLAKVVHDYGDITALGDGAIFYIGSGFFGNVISTAEGYSYGDSASFTNMDTSVDSNDVNNYIWASTTPLADGQTAQPAAPTYGVNFTRIISYEWKSYAAGSQPVSSENADEAFDNNNSKWFGFKSQGAWVVVQLVTDGSYAPTRAVQKIQFRTAGDAQERDPTGYRIWGSVDGVNWVLIKEEAISLPAGRNADSPIYELNNVTAYSYYKIEFTGTKGAGDAFQINEIRLLYDVDDPQGELAGGGVYVQPTPIYRSSVITSTQANRRSSNLSETTGHNAQVDITGDGNDVYILQAGTGGHYASVSIQGNSNDVDVNQTSTIGARHYLEAAIIGSSNIIDATQSDTAKTQFVSVNGNNNNITTSQTGTGNHFLDLSITGDDHTAGITQQGSGNHEARVTLDGSQPWNFSLTQDGSTSQRYTLPHDMSDGSVVSGTCSTIGGCNLNINQQ